MGTILAVMFSVCIAEMGDKTQLFVMGLATKHKTRDIIFGVGLATILLNAIGVFMGSVIAKTFPIEYVNLAAGFLFLVFALLTIEDGGEKDAKIRGKSFFAIGVAFFVAELGDKTQLSAIAFSAGNPDVMFGVFIGATCGMLIADFAGLVFAKLIGKRIPDKIMKLSAYLIFTVFGFKTLWSNFDLFLPHKSISLTFMIALLFGFFSLVLLRSKKNEC